MEEGDQASVGRSEIDELLHDLVHRHELNDETDESLPMADDPSLEDNPSPVGLQRGLPVVAVVGLLALVVAGFVSAGFVAGGFLLAQGEPNQGSEAVGSSPSTDGDDNADLSDRGAAVDEAAEDVVAPSDAFSEASAEAEPSEATEPAAPPKVSQLRVGIVLPRDADDMAFSQSMADGAATMLDAGDIGDMVMVENVSSGGAREQIRRLADEGYDLVVAHSSVYQTLVFDLASDYPDVTFAVAGTTDPVPGDNVFTYTAAAEEGGYLLGALGAMLSTGGVVGVVGPSEVGVSKRYVDGFRQGATDERADLVVRVTYTGSFTDGDAFAAATERHLEAGADVITGHGSDLDAAIGIASDQQAVWLGSQVDPMPVAPRSVVASQVYRWEVVLGQIVTEIEAGEVEGRHLIADLANGGIVITLNDPQARAPEMRDRVDELTAEINAGLLRPLDGR